MKKFISLILAILLLVSMTANVITVSAADSDGTPIVVTFKDNNLKKKVASTLGVSSSSNITDEMMLKLTELYAGDADIYDITGLEYAKNLEILSLYDNYISDLSPIKDLKNITSLGLANNYLDSIDAIAGYTKLDMIDISRNNISDISPIAKSTSMRILIASNANISDLSPLQNLTKLEQVQLANNNISDISTVSKFTNLIKLDLYENSVLDISPLRGLSKLEELDLAHNKISDISPLLDIENLDSVSIRYNNLVAKEGNETKRVIDALVKKGVTVKYRFLVSFYVNGSVHDTREVDLGKSLTDIPEVPQMEGKIGKWSVTDFSNISVDMDVEAIYEPIMVTVSFYVDGKLTATVPVEYGSGLDELPVLPKIEGKDVSWDVANVDLNSITSDIRINAKIVDKQYTVKFIANGSQVAARTVTHGGTLTDIPAVPKIEGKTGKWNVTDFSNITSDIEVYAVYEDIVATVTFYVDGEKYAAKQVSYGGTLTDIPAVPQKNGYYAAWDTDNFANIKADMVVNAVYTPMAILEEDYFKIEVNEKFTIKLTTKCNVTNIGIKNESGKFMGKSGCVGVIDPNNPDYMTWIVTISIGSKGIGRKLSVWIKEDGQFIDANATINADVFVKIPVEEDEGAKLVGDNAITIDKNNVKVNEQFTLTVKTNKEVTNIKLTNESGKILGKVSQKSVDVGNVRTWTIVVQFGSKGANRRIDVSLQDQSGKYGEMVGSTQSITVVK